MRLFKNCQKVCVMRELIDFHAHLGDIFTGNNVSFRTGLVRPEDLGDCFAENDRNGFTYTAQGKPAEELQERMMAGQRRLQFATCENIGRTLDKEGGVYSVLLPIYPYTSFEEYVAASRCDPRFIPFTSMDFSRPEKEIIDKLRSDIEHGAKGLKLHPVIQNRRLLDPIVLEAVELFGKAGLPVVTHVGKSNYYVRSQEEKYPTTIEFGAIEDFVELARTFPHYDLVAAHCCRNYPSALAEMTRGLDHVYTDTTFAGAAHIRETVDALGEDRLLFGTDYPFSDMHYAALQVELAFGENSDVAGKIFSGNARRLLNL